MAGFSHRNVVRLRTVLAGLILTAASSASAVCPVIDTIADGAGPPVGSLRDCINFANATPGRDTLTFDPAVFTGGTITLVSNLPALTDPAGVVIDGGDATNVVVDGSGYGSSVAFVLSSSNNALRNLTVRGFTAAGFNAAAVTFGAGTNGNVVEGLLFLGNQGMGVNLLGDNFSSVITGSAFTNTGNIGVRVQNAAGGTCANHTVIAGNVFTGAPATLDDAIYATDSVCLELADNTMTGFASHAIRFADSSDCQVLRNTITDSRAAIGIFGGTANCVVGFNVVKDGFGYGIGAGDTGTTGTRIEGNVVLRTRVQPASGHGIYLFSGADGTRVVNNTLHGNEGNAVRVDTGPTDVRLHNNLFTGSVGAGIALIEPSVIHSHNGFFGNGGGACEGGCTLGADSVVGDPGYLAAGAPDDDVRPACGGPAVNAGLDLLAEQPDLTPAADGRRFEGSAPDLGALEQNCALPVPEPAPSSRQDLTVGCACSSDLGGAARTGLAPIGLGLLAALRTARRRGR